MSSVGIPNMYNSNASTSADDQASGLDVLGFLRRRKSFVIVLAALGTGIGYMMFQRQVPIFRSTALVQVIHQKANPKIGMMMTERDLSDAVFEITSPSLIIPAYEKQRLDELVMLRGLSADSAASQIAGMLTVKPGQNSKNVIEIAIQAARADEIPLIVNAIAEEYVARQIENYKDARVELDATLMRQKELLHAELKEKETEYNVFRDTSGLMSDGKNPHRERQQSYLAKLSSLSLDETSIKAELTTLEAALKEGGSREALLMVIGKMNPNSGPGALTNNSRSMEERMVPLFLEQKELEAKLGKDHPRVKAIERRIEFTRELLQKLAIPTETGDVVPVTDFISIYLQSLRQQIQTIVTERGDLETQASEAERLARALANDENEDRSRKNEIERLSELFHDASSHVTETKINAEYGGVKAQVLTPARQGNLIYPTLTRFLGMGALLGGFLGMVIGYVVEIADRSFRKPEDLIREFGVPILGHIPFMTAKQLTLPKYTNPMDKSAVSIHSPRSRPAEAFRSVRTAICFSPSGSLHRVLQITSPSVGDGKSTLALNLAISLAMSGKRTILMESDFRRPKVHKLSAVSNKLGTVDVLRGTTELTDAIQNTAIESLFVLPCGTRPKDPAELLSRPEYEQLLEVLRQKYDYVIVDSPPMLAVTDPASIAPRVDAVIVAMRLNRHTRGQGLRTTEALREIGATLCGIVINGVEGTEGYGYGYGSYNYSYYRYSGRYYGKKYDYSYGSKGKAKGDYFEEEPVESTDANTPH